MLKVPPEMVKLLSAFGEPAFSTAMPSTSSQSPTTDLPLPPPNTEFEKVPPEMVRLLPAFTVEAALPPP